MTTNNQGFWGVPTASVNWCEPDYQHSYYIAETYNTLSNLFYVIMAIISLIHTRSFYRKLKNQAPILLKGMAKGGNPTDSINGPLVRFYWMNLSLIMVGVGSWMFHMTLQVRDQMWDELSMHLPILSLLYCLWNHRDYISYSEDKRVFKYFISWSHFLSFLFTISVFSFLFAVYDVHTPILFIATFFFEMIFSYAFSIKLSNTPGGPSLTSKLHMKQKKNLIRCVFASFILAFTVWNMDKAMCGYGIDALKLHSFWHLFTAYGSYLWAVFLLFSYYADKHDYLVSIGLTENNNKKGYHIEWKWYVLPWIQFGSKAIPYHKPATA